MDAVYIETTIVGHIAGRVHPDPLVAARQQMTRDWRQNEAAGYEPPVICTPEELVEIDDDS